jgi:hypothetical protein
VLGVFEGCATRAFGVILDFVTLQDFANGRKSCQPLEDPELLV